MAKVFISYRHVQPDEPLANQLASYLESNQFSPAGRTTRRGCGGRIAERRPALRCAIKTPFTPLRSARMARR